MTDNFDAFLSSVLAPPARDPDRQFVLRLQARIALEERLAAERRTLTNDLLKQLAGLLANAAGIFCIATSAAVTSLFAEAPALVLAALLAAFALVIALIAMRPGSTSLASLN
jgi:hypothetical protein